MKRKTIKASDIIEVANRALRNSENSMVEHRRSIISVIDEILLENDLYEGKAYLLESESHEGYTFGVSFNEKGEPVLHDRSRMKYFLP